VLGLVQDLEAILAAHEIQQVLVLGMAWPEGFLQRCVSACEREGVRLFVVSDLDRQFRHTVTTFEDKGVQLIGLREEPLENPLNRLSKRLVDLLIAVPVILLVLPPAILLAWVLQRWQSPGPLFFRQQRSGYRKRIFMMYKFRTMHAQNDDETRQARRDDPRVFAGGMWMRRFSLDELPQFINVLRGDMSVVGPRPHMPAHDTVFIQTMNNYRVRAAVKPGLTGLAQVRGYRGETNTREDVAKRVASDIEYLERWTLGLDFWIIARTFWQVVFPPKTAY
jgi:lipopolysaccharide/colanic/teichoic acid biosynthesis glycosyltransferase